MNEEREEEQIWCYFHPKELVIGICALCLKERLLVLASKQKTHYSAHKKLLPKIFAITSLINPLDIKHHKSEVYDDDYDYATNYSSASIKFEDNGVASWDKGDDPQYNSLDNANKIKSVVEHARPRATLRWRKRIGHLLQIIRWKRSATSKGNVCQVGTKFEGAKVKRGWIRILTKRRTRE
ncbi:hypothetical protein PHJA_001124300 [Phtheirospermum japonicum]|uniref:Uncharacterized protein n=1 Tax=Phtheirospermum japonicum TaxID=374723 RepID=A0A830C346_9LAMI|nr:hypothetical protein PHJA_001124300 [Phtheirospermum japonicum]